MVFIPLPLVQCLPHLWILPLRVKPFTKVTQLGSSDTTVMSEYIWFYYTVFFPLLATLRWRWIRPSFSSWRTYNKVQGVVFAKNMTLSRFLKIVSVLFYLPIIISKGLYHDYEKKCSGYSRIYMVWILNSSPFPLALQIVFIKRQNKSVWSTLTVKMINDNLKSKHVPMFKPVL